MGPKDFISNLRFRNNYNPDLFQQDGTTPDMNNPLNFPTTNPYGDLFQPGQIQAPPTPSPGPTDIDVDALYNQYYHPEHQASDRFSQLSAAYPPDKGHSKLARIGAALLAGGTSYVTDDPMRGFQLGTGVLDYKRKGDIEDWKNQIQPAQQAANLERYSNANERQVASSRVSQTLADRKQEQANAIAEEKVRIADLRAKVYDWKAHNAGSKIIVQPGGHTIAVNSTTGETLRDFGPSGKMDEATKLDLEQEYKQENIKTGGEEARKTEGVRQTGRETIAETRGWKPFQETGPDGKPRTFMYNEITGEKRYDVPEGSKPIPRGGGASDKPLNETQRKVGVYNRALELINTDKELAPFVRIKSNGEPRVTAPGEGGFFGNSPSQEQYNRIRKKLYGDAAGPMTDSTTSQSTSVRVQSPDGRTGTWDLSKGPVPPNFKKIQ